MKRIKSISLVLFSLLVLFITLLGILYAIDLLSDTKNIDYTKIHDIQNIIQIALFFGLVLYTAETLLSREATEKLLSATMSSLLFEQRPCLVLRTKKIKENNYRLNIKNIGRGAALNISVEIIDPINKNNGKYKLYNNTKYLPIGDDKSIKFSNSETDIDASLNFSKTDLANQKEGFKVKIKCSDASNGPMTEFLYEIRPEKNANWDISAEKIGTNPQLTSPEVQL